MTTMKGGNDTGRIKDCVYERKRERERREKGRRRGLG
jgi:hypothetical protein